MQDHDSAQPMGHAAHGDDSDSSRLENLGVSASAFSFHGNWKDFARIVFPNLLLTIVTLGVYRFWAMARERQYLWSQSQFIDERLEWRGTGLELFIGFVLVAILIGLPLLFLQFGFQALLLRGYKAIAITLFMISLIMIFYLSGVARFRALRYRLSRTFWRGIRGGSNIHGFIYGLSYMWKTVAGYAAIGLMVPWSMTSLWNERWNKMSFGPHDFTCHARFENIFLRYLLFYFSPYIFMFAMIFFVGMSAGFMAIVMPDQKPDGPVIALLFVAVVLFYFLLGLVFMVFYSAFFREAVEQLSLYRLDFSFTARTKDWIILFVVDVLLVIGTIGIGYLFLSYRHWKFFINHMEAWGEINVDELTQSDTAKAGHGEGLLDAFDVGAI